MEAHKNDKEKIDLSQVPKSFLEAAARAFMYGEKKYNRNNWRNGFDWNRLYGALQRHSWAWWEGEEVDPESGLSHLDHMAATLAMLIEHENKGLGTDNRYNEERDFFKEVKFGQKPKEGMYAETMDNTNIGDICDSRIWPAIPRS